MSGFVTHGAEERGRGGPKKNYPGPENFQQVGVAYRLRVLDPLGPPGPCGSPVFPPISEEASVCPDSKVTLVLG